MNIKKTLAWVLVVLIISLFVSCKNKTEETIATQGQTSIILATTTSTENSGLLDYILPHFKEETGIKIKVVAVGTGKALQMGMDGEVDVLLVHAKSSEEKFVEEGHGTERFDVMYNDFVIIGPKDDGANKLKKVNGDVIEAFKILSDGSSTFISRGDDSGTHKKEKAFWQEADIKPSGDWYVSAGKGMGDVIQMTNEMLGYTMADRATYLSMKEDIDLDVVIEGDPKLFNQYGVIAVNPKKNDHINSKGAKIFVQWILSEEVQELISELGKEEFGQPLFIPNAN